MERRKVQKTGGSTYTVSLPKIWAEERLAFGDHVSIEKKDNYLKLFSDTQNDDEQRTSISFNEDTETLFRKTVSLYLSGYDHINIVSSDEMDSNELEAKVKDNMVGLEVVRSSGSRIELKNLVRYEDLPFQKVLVRIDSLLQSIMDEITESLEEEETDGLVPSVEDKEQEVDKMYMLGVRQLKHASVNPEALEKLEIESESECVSLRVVLKSLERIGDHLRTISREIDKADEVPDSYISYIRGVKTCYRTSLDALRKKDPEKAESAIQKSRSTPDIPRDTLETEELLSFRQLENSIQRVKLLSDDVAEVVMNITIEEREENNFFS